VLGDVGIDRGDIQMDSRVRFRIPVCEKKNGYFGLSRVRSLVLELMDEALLRLGRQIGNRRLVIDAEYQVSVRSLFGDSEALHEEWDFLSRLGVRQRDGE